MPKARAVTAKSTPKPPTEPIGGLLAALMEGFDLAAWDVPQKDQSMVNAIYAKMSEHDRRESVRIVTQMGESAREAKG